MQQEYIKIVSGQKKGTCAACIKILLTIISAGYIVIINLRNFLYSRKLLKTHKVNAVVISIGNITTGGTGKTPLVIWLCDFLRENNIEPAVLTRGYKTGKKESGIDEPAVILQNCPKIKVIVNPNRATGARLAIEKFGSKVLILDDGFQHRRLARDIDIVTIDATEPFGFGKILPAGLLREPVSSLKRADAVVLTRCNLTGQQKLEEIETQLRKIKGNFIIAKTIHKPISLVFGDGKEKPSEYLAGKRIFAFCGIGNPESFFKTAENIGAKITGKETFDDHHIYSQEDIERICKRASDSKAELIITTEKDWTKIACLNIPASPTDFDSVSSRRAAHQGGKENNKIVYMKIKIHFIEGVEELTDLIEKAVEGKISQGTNGHGLEARVT